MAIRKPRGTQDFLPEQMINWHYIEQRMREICKVYGVQRNSYTCL